MTNAETEVLPPHSFQVFSSRSRKWLLLLVVSFLVVSFCVLWIIGDVRRIGVYPALNREGALVTINGVPFPKAALTHYMKTGIAKNSIVVLSIDRTVPFEDVNLQILLGLIRERRLSMVFLRLGGDLGEPDIFDCQLDPINDNPLSDSSEHRQDVTKQMKPTPNPSQNKPELDKQDDSGGDDGKP